MRGLPRCFVMVDSGRSQCVCRCVGTGLAVFSLDAEEFLAALLMVHSNFGSATRSACVFCTFAPHLADRLTVSHFCYLMVANIGRRARSNLAVFLTTRIDYLTPARHRIVVRRIDHHQFKSRKCNKDKQMIRAFDRGSQTIERRRTFPSGVGELAPSIWGRRAADGAPQAGVSATST